MDGKKREQKLIIKDGATMSPKEIMREVRELLEEYASNTQDEQPISLYYKDTYYDDYDESLYKSGGSLKVRYGVNKIGSTEKIVVMRTKTKNPKKLKCELFWDEMEIPVIQQKTEDLGNLIEPLKGIFVDFDFSKLKEEPVLICETYRTLFKLDFEKDKVNFSISFLFDHIRYESNGKIAGDSLLKIRGIGPGNSLYEMLYNGIMEKFPEYTLVEGNRYERALEKLSKVE